MFSYHEQPAGGGCGAPRRALACWYQHLTRHDDPQRSHHASACGEGSGKMITPAQAIAAYPELARLFEMTRPNLTAPNWTFKNALFAGQVDALRGVRVWRDGTVDQVGIKGPSDAAACRFAPGGVMVWLETGTVGDVCDKVMAQLLPPNHPYAPRNPIAVVIGQVPGFGNGQTA